MKTLDDVVLSDLLPDSISKDENVKAAAEAIDPQLRAVSENVDIPSIYVNIDKLSSGVLDHLAKQYDVTVWRDSWTVSLKRSVLKTAISEKRTKGTKAAIIDALASISSAATIVEWWETNPKGTPHTFTINATQSKIEGVIDEEMQEDLFALIDDAKPLRSHYKFVLQQNASGGINVYGCMRAISYASIRATGKVSENVSGAIGIVAGGRPIIQRRLIARA
nr:MAG TPA: tail protein [Caudoviricetes sp.]